MQRDLQKAFERADILGLTDTSLAKLSGLSTCAMSLYRSEHRPCPGDKAKRIVEVVKDLERLARIVEPLPIDFRRPVALAAALQKFATVEAIQ
jgi:hypothetical protein